MLAWWAWPVETHLWWHNLVSKGHVWEYSNAPIGTRSPCRLISLAFMAGPSTRCVEGITTNECYDVYQFPKGALTYRCRPTFLYHSVSSSEFRGVTGIAECPTIWITALTILIAPTAFIVIQYKIEQWRSRWLTSALKQIHNMLATWSMSKDYNMLCISQPFKKIWAFWHQKPYCTDWT